MKQNMNLKLPKDVNLKLPNDMEVIVWQDTEGVYLGVVNNNGYVITDRKLTVREADALNSVSYCP